MIYDIPMTLSQIENKLGRGKDCYQLLTIEGDDFSQIKGLVQIAKKILEKYPQMDMYISSNDHDFGTYYGLEVDDQYLNDTDIEDVSISIAEELGYDV